MTYFVNNVGRTPLRTYVKIWQPKLLSTIYKNLKTLYSVKDSKDRNGKL